MGAGRSRRAGRGCTALCPGSRRPCCPCSHTHTAQERLPSMIPPQPGLPLLCHPSHPRPTGFWPAAGHAALSFPSSAAAWITSDPGTAAWPTWDAPLLPAWLAPAPQDVHQSQLETVVPGGEGTPLLVLAGKFKGRRARLLQRNTETGLAAVQVRVAVEAGIPHPTFVFFLRWLDGPAWGWRGVVLAGEFVHACLAPGLFPSIPSCTHSRPPVMRACTCLSALRSSPAISVCTSCPWTTSPSTLDPQTPGTSE